uniref:Uncharacterized protein n=1 Tax=Arundo donax TaxID=35708 RepID=A0A0A9AMM2_ARUDO
MPVIGRKSTQQRWRLSKERKREKSSSPVGSACRTKTRLMRVARPR